MSMEVVTVGLFSGFVVGFVCFVTFLLLLYVDVLRSVFVEDLFCSPFI